MPSLRLMTSLTFLSLIGIGVISFIAGESQADETNPIPTEMTPSPQAKEEELESEEIEPAVVAGLNPSESLGDYLGYGIGIHTSDVDFPKAFDDLQPHFVRMEFGPRWELVAEEIPSGKTVDEYVSYLQRNYDGDFPDRLEKARTSHQFLRERGIQIIKIRFELPYHWRAKDGSNQFLSEHIEDLARFHTGHLKFLSENGIHIDYMELANEPDGPWNGHLMPYDYAHLLERCDTLFEEHGFGEVKLLGPGLTFLNLHNTPQPYFEALVDIGPKHLDGWSTHIWDEAEFTHSLPEYTYGVWKPFLELVEKVDPERKKPLFVTEYASDIIDFGDQKWASPRDQVTDTVVDQWPHAVRVIANSITNLNRGTNGLVVYRLSDTHWHDTGWGVMTQKTPPDFEPKPVYHALANTLATLPRNSTILAPTWYDHNDPITLSILHQREEHRLHLIAVNSTATSQTKSILLSPELAQLSLADFTSYVETGISQESDLTIADSWLALKLPPFSIARITLKQQREEVSSNF